MTIRLDILLLSALCLLLSVTAGSCAQDDLYMPDEPGSSATSSGSRISLKFKIYADNAAPATRGLGEWEENSANQSERYLNPQDMRVLILSHDKKLLKSVKPANLEFKKEGEEETFGITGDGHYDVTIFFEDEYFDNYFKQHGDNASINFHVMVFANMNSVGCNYTTDALSPGEENAKLNEIFSMPYDWFPSDSENKGIPMFGYVQNITATKKALTQVGGFELKDDKPMYLMRALCKVEVSDKIKKYTGSDGKEYPRVTGVEMTSWYDKGNLRTSVDNYYENSSLSRAYIPSNASKIENQSITARYIDDNGDGTGVFRLYCPEAPLPQVNMLVTVETGPGTTKECKVNLAKYIYDSDGNTPLFGNDLVRNHIYRFEVNSIGTQAELTLDVLPWSKVEYTFDNKIEIPDGGQLVWDIDGNRNFSVTTDNVTKQQTLSILNATTEYATGSFLITSPVNSTWRAYLIPGENGVDAFEFVDVDAAGNVTGTHSYVEGKVGERATIRLRGKGAADAYRHYAELVVVVRQPDGTTLYAPITKESDRFIIYREDKL